MSAKTSYAMEKTIKGRHKEESRDEESEKELDATAYARLLKGLKGLPDNKAASKAVSLESMHKRRKLDSGKPSRIKREGGERGLNVPKASAKIEVKLGRIMINQPLRRHAVARFLLACALCWSLQD